MKRYRINASEHFNLLSMYDHLKVIEANMEESESNAYSAEEWTKLYKQLEKVQTLMNKAHCVGALVDWPTLKAVREIKAERQMIRYRTCLADGSDEREAALAFEL